jgi:hypothetical protein
MELVLFAVWWCWPIRPKHVEIYNKEKNMNQSSCRIGISVVDDYRTMGLLEITIGVDFQLSSLWVKTCFGWGTGTVRELRGRETSAAFGSRYQTPGEHYLLLFTITWNEVAHRRQNSFRPETWTAESTLESVIGRIMWKWIWADYGLGLQTGSGKHSVVRCDSALWCCAAR